MSLPPELIRVKRKASEIEPVSYLRVQEHKRHVTDAFVYQRQKQEAAFAHIPVPSSQRPIIHTSGAKRGNAAFQSTKDNNNNNSTSSGDEESSKAPDAAGGDLESAGPGDEPRRFHMSRADIMLASSNYPTQRKYRGIAKKRSAPALFVERKHKRLPSTKFQSIAHGLNVEDPKEEALGASRHSTSQTQSPSRSDQMEVDNAATKLRKKPGLARQAQQEGTASPKKAELPTSMVDRWNVNLDQLTADMNAFALEQIGINLQRQEEEERKQRERDAAQRARIAAVTSSSTTFSSPSPSRFKPKAPAKRYAERHPENVPKSVDDDATSPDGAASGTDDEDYIIETYVRVPASTIRKQHVASKDVGLLVFDEEPDMEYFYGGNSDSEDEYAEDEDDENAENHYTADYPDDEVASDDEFGQNAYAYRNGNASDLEEYDVNGYQEINPDDDSDSKDGFKSFIGRDGTIRKHL
ncbi:hypothetical protein PFICI_08153 [Pestalotiopsis fici W106-1]|uniref:Transcription factor Iwr1 domain-containing protein n=1 Tax=Pestalotiopsis fici (strain W106-1 / CGMCC3.15140) TaxID=1229662 RepID=W3X3P0_PESFW|nr:uncharacterized protein PFICI_08153 [Pestalotiopsis fici W106-1]ETS80624.1 hypothetical protein PFICI_08153 [Pestalotiopsis fici W106-1]